MATASWDKTVRIWDPNTGEYRPSRFPKMYGGAPFIGNCCLWTCCSVVIKIVAELFAFHRRSVLPSLTKTGVLQASSSRRSEGIKKGCGPWHSTPLDTRVRCLPRGARTAPPDFGIPEPAKLPSRFLGVTRMLCESPKHTLCGGDSATPHQLLSRADPLDGRNRGNFGTLGTMWRGQVTGRSLRRHLRTELLLSGTPKPARFFACSRVTQTR
jgi:hypothetical protein